MANTSDAGSEITEPPSDMEELLQSVYARNVSRDKPIHDAGSGPNLGSVDETSNRVLVKNEE